jgi:trehalose synthase
VNSTPVGGDVAELLTRLVPLMRELGVETAWEVIKGDQQFFVVTKALNQALSGKPGAISQAMLDTYRTTMETNLRDLQFAGDVIFIHDPQPAGLVEHKQTIGRRWIWHAHIDLSAPDPAAWSFLRPFVERYDASVFSMPDFGQKIAIPQFVIPPSIDPLSDKNKELEYSSVREVLERHHIDPARPIITQVSHFDRLTDPLGVISAYRVIRKRHDCQLVLAGDGQIDDPESLNVLSEVQEQAAGDSDIHVLLLPPFSDLEVNALVRGSTIVMQKSIREGFGLSVSEAMWKKKPVIGGAAGGIKRQIVNGFTGFLVFSPEGAAHRASQLLTDPDLCKRMGENGHLHVKQNFLITRQVKDYLLVVLALDYHDQDVVFLA